MGHAARQLIVRLGGKIELHLLTHDGGFFQPINDDNAKFFVSCGCPIHLEWSEPMANLPETLPSGPISCDCRPAPERVLA